MPVRPLHSLALVCFARATWPNESGIVHGRESEHRVPLPVTPLSPLFYSFTNLSLHSAAV